MNTIRCGLVVAAILALPPTAEAQRRADTVVGVDVDVFGATLTYARGGSGGRYRGVEFGLGGAYFNKMLLAGRHFSQDGGLAYEERDGGHDDELFELVHLGAFQRWEPSRRATLDAGLRASLFYHSDSSDEKGDFALPLFFGTSGGLSVGGDRVKVGPRLLVGLFMDGINAREFGVLLVPLTGRISFGW